MIVLVYVISRFFTAKNNRIFSRNCIFLSDVFAFFYCDDISQCAFSPTHIPISSKFFEMVSISRFDSSCSVSSSR